MIWWSAGLIVIGVVCGIADFRRHREMERTLMLVAWGAFTLLGVLGTARDLGYIRDEAVYWAVDASLFLLFAALVWQVQQHKKGRF